MSCHKATDNQEGTLFIVFMITYILRPFASVKHSVCQGVSAPGALSTLVTSVALYSLTRATLMSPGQDEICVCG